MVGRRPCRRDSLLILLKSVFSEKWPAGGPAQGTPYLYKKVCFSEKWPAGGPAEGTPYLYYKKHVFSEKWPAGGPAEGTPYLSKYVFYAFGAHMRRFSVSGPAICMKFRPRSNGIGPSTPKKKGEKKKLKKYSCLLK